jgi:hypothetical protein
MPTADINYLAVVAAAVISMVVGFVWYSLTVFGKTWMKEVGLTMKQISNGPNAGYAITMVGALIQAYVLAHVVQYAGAATWAEGLVTGLWLSVGLVATAIAANYVFAQRSRTLWLIDAGYFVTTFALNGVLLAVWR